MHTDCAVPIFFDERQCLERYERVWSPATSPCRFIAAARQQHNLVNLRPVIPAAPEELYLSHDREYVDGVLAGRRNNGYENTDPDVANASLWAVGAMIQAAFHAPSSSYAVFAPVSDFRQAGYSEGGAFSTFNGVTVAAAKFLAEHPGAVIGILDCTNQRALGTEDILSRLPQLAEGVVFLSSSRDYTGAREDVVDYTDWLESATATLNEARCNLVFYLASADFRMPSNGGVRLSTTGRMLRDRHVFMRIAAPLVCSFSGGSGLPAGEDDMVVRSYRITLQQAMQAFGTRDRVRALGCSPEGR